MRSAIITVLVAMIALCLVLPVVSGNAHVGSGPRRRNPRQCKSKSSGGNVDAFVHNANANGHGDGNGHRWSGAWQSGSRGGGDQRSASFQVLVATSSEDAQPETSARETRTSTLTVTRSARPSTTQDARTSERPVVTSREPQPTTSLSVDDSNTVGKVSDLDPKALLGLHNAYRQGKGAGAMTWDNSLQEYATEWGLKCTMKHSDGPHGENLAVNYGSAASLFKLWTDESSDYDPANPTYSHFTQVVWKGSTKLGCALISCPDGTIFTGYGRPSTYLVCEYDPPGNVIGKFADNVQA